MVLTVYQSYICRRERVKCGVKERGTLYDGKYAAEKELHFGLELHCVYDVRIFRRILYYAPHDLMTLLSSPM